MPGREELVELPEGWWRGLKAHVSGWIGEVFALAYVSKFTPPSGELWTLRAPYIATAWRIDYFREGERWERIIGRSLMGSFLLGELVTAFLPPSRFKLPPGLPRKVGEDLERFMAAWVPDDVKEAARVLARSERVKGYFSTMRQSLLGEDAVEEELARVLECIKQRSSGPAVSFVLESPASDFAAFDLIDRARAQGDVVLLKFESQGLIRGEEEVFVPEITVKDAPPNLKAGWVIEVEPKDAINSVASKLMRALALLHPLFTGGRGRRIVYVAKGKLFVRKCVSREELERALEIARAMFVEEEELLRRLRCPVYRALLKGVEVLEVKTETGKLAPVQVEALRGLQRLQTKVESAVGRRIEVSYRILRIRFRDSLEIPRSALVESREQE